MKVSFHFIVSCALGALMGGTVLVIFGPADSIWANAIVGLILGLPIFWAETVEGKKLMTLENIARAYRYATKASVWAVGVTLLCLVISDISWMAALLRGLAAGVIITGLDILIDRYKKAQAHPKNH
jgi:hypothetical protein